MSCESCRNEQRIIALERDSERNQATHKEYFKKFEDLNIARATSDTKLDQIMATVVDLSRGMDKMNFKVDEITLKPVKKWDNLVWLVVTSIVSGIIGYIISTVTGG